jgi:hypothetical protein
MLEARSLSDLALVRLLHRRDLVVAAVLHLDSTDCSYFHLCLSHAAAPRPAIKPLAKHAVSR